MLSGLFGSTLMNTVLIMFGLLFVSGRF